MPPLIVKRCLRPPTFIKIILFCVTFTLPLLIFANYREYKKIGKSSNGTLIIIVTPTNKKLHRLADMTRFSQTLMHIKGLHWVVVEDGDKTYPAIENVLKRSGIPYTYVNTVTPFRYGSKRRGWAQRNYALDYLRRIYFDYVDNAVVYFADDDNTYDIRLFENYIRNVDTVGIWPVGTVGGALVEAPIVEKGKIKSFHVYYDPSRTFATDMAGFAVNLRLIRNSTASFSPSCPIYQSENCFLKELGISLDQVQPFGYNDDPKEILVWHTQTIVTGDKGDDWGYLVAS